LGPYAFAELSPYTDARTSKIRTRVAIEWPDETPDESWLLHAIVVPVPLKLRLTLARLRALGLIAAQALGDAFKEPRTTLDSKYELSRNYAARAYGFGLSEEGLFQLICKTPLSRYVGLIEVSSQEGPLLDVVVDATETNAEPAALACVKRRAFPATRERLFETIAEHLGARAIS
jgi:hypothetical protein